MAAGRRAGDERAVAATRRESGQAMIETAIVMPLFVFILLGTVQLGLMHQARLLTKYAAFKATRAGTLYHANAEVMKRAALAVIAPMASIEKNSMQRGYGKNMKTTTASEYAARLQQQDVRSNKVDGNSSIDLVEVTICSPTTTNQGIANTPNGVSFDNPATIWGDSGGDASWQNFQKTKLTVQVTFNYRMPIPFANMMLYYIARGQERADLFLVTRVGDPSGSGGGNQDRAGTFNRIVRTQHDQYATDGLGYVLPIRANYSLRMMSDLFPGQAGFEIPQNNDCVVPFNRESA